MRPFKIIPPEQLEVNYRNSLLEILGEKSNYFTFNQIQSQNYNERIDWWTKYSFHQNLVVRHIAKYWLCQINKEIQCKAREKYFKSKL